MAAADGTQALAAVGRPSIFNGNLKAIIAVVVAVMFALPGGVGLGRYALPDTDSHRCADSERLAVRIVDFEKSSAEVNGNRFTSADGMEMWVALNNLKTQIAIAEPPQWFIKRVDGLETTQREILVEIKEIRRRVNP